MNVILGAILAVFLIFFVLMTGGVGLIVLAGLGVIFLIIAKLGKAGPGGLGAIVAVLVLFSALDRAGVVLHEKVVLLTYLVVAAVGWAISEFVVSVLRAYRDE